MDCLWYYASSCVEQPVPTGVKEIYGLEGHIKNGGYFREPSYLRFTASKDFVDQLVSANTPYYGKYFSISCDRFFTVITEYRHIQDYPREFEWWQPSSVKMPTCYLAARDGETHGIYLLVDSNGYCISISNHKALSR